MSPYLLIPLLGVMALLQVTVAPHITLAGVKPDLMLSIVVSWSLLRGVREGIAWAFLGGLWLDLFAGGPFGISALALMAVSLACAAGELNIFRSHLLLPLFTVVLGTAVFGLIYLLLLQVLGYTVVWLDALRRVMLPSMAFNALTLPLIYVPLGWLNRLTGREQMNW
ncbi:MAG: rod shape-determining protein MreD [Anaerolineae bacterium]|nr:rod shape-determining protein MreD [Anaerolineae bacterium]